MKRLVEEDPMWDALSILRLDTRTAKDDKSLPQSTVLLRVDQVAHCGEHPSTREQIEVRGAGKSLY